MKVIHKDCDSELAKDKSLPVNSYLVCYIENDEKKYDIVQSGSSVDVFDIYYDQYGKGNVRSIEWTDGTINPKLYGYTQKTKKQKK